MPFPISPLRRFNESLMDDATQVVRDTVYTDVDGYERTTEAVVADTVSFGVDLTASEQIVANQAGYRAQAKRYLPFGTDVTERDRLQVGDRTYEIESINTETSDGLSAAVELLVRRTT